MLPFYFGAGDHRLFGVYDVPARSSSRQGVVICNAVGSEYFNAHRTCRVLARQLAGSGVHVLRFDYLGTGDSTGEVDHLRVADWLKDIETAITELLDLAELRKVDLIGLRAGAALAATAAKKSPKVGRVCLWDPIPSSSDSAGGTDLTEFPSALRSDLSEAMKLEDPTLPPGSIMVCTGSGPRAYELLANRLTAACSGLDITFHVEHGAWESGGDEFGSLPAPVLSLQTILEWSAGRSGI